MGSSGERHDMTQPLSRLVWPLCLLAVAALWTPFAKAQSQPRDGNNITELLILSLSRSEAVAADHLHEHF
jgi:hypothetical protein